MNRGQKKLKTLLSTAASRIRNLQEKENVQISLTEISSYIIYFQQLFEIRTVICILYVVQKIHTSEQKYKSITLGIQCSLLFTI